MLVGIGASFDRIELSQLDSCYYMATSRLRQVLAPRRRPGPDVRPDHRGGADACRNRSRASAPVWSPISCGRPVSNGSSGAGPRRGWSTAVAHARAAWVIGPGYSALPERLSGGGASVAELADAPDLEPGACRACGFEPRRPHQPSLGGLRGLVHRPLQDAHLLVRPLRGPPADGHPALTGILAR